MQLDGKRVAILVAKGYEQAELFEPRQALLDAGALVEVISPEQGSVRAWNQTEWGSSIPVDVPLAEADAKEYDALLLPGGVMNPDYLRQEPKAVAFVQEFIRSGKPLAAICHGPLLLAEAEVLQGRRLTSYPSIKTDLRHAGAEWVDEEVVVDRGLVTSRSPKDIPAFNRKMIEEFAEGRHQRSGRQPQLVGR